MIKADIRKIALSFMKSTYEKLFGVYNKIKIFNPLILNVLTFFLIIVTIFSCIATQRITDVSISLEKIRQKEQLANQIDMIDKLITELENNLNTATDLHGRIDMYRNNALLPNIKFFLTRINSAPELITELDDDLLDEFENYKIIFDQIQNNIENIKENNPDANLKNDAIDRARQNLGVLINGGRINNKDIIKGLPDLISKLEKQKSQLEKQLIEIDKGKFL